MLEIKEMAKPLQTFSQLMLIHSLMMLKASLSHPFVVFNETARLWNKVLSEKLPWLIKTEKALLSFSKMIDEIEEIEGLYIKMREVYERSPSGYITEIRVIILDSTRELEYRIYDVFGELLRTSSPLLFDLHIIKLRGRKIEEVIPEGFWRYE